MPSYSLAQTYDELDRLFTDALRSIQASPLALTQRVAEMKILWDALDKCHNPHDVEEVNRLLRTTIARFSQEVSHA